MMDQPALRANIAHIVIIQANRPPRAPATHLLFRTAVENNDDVFADLPKPVALPILETIPHGHNDHDGGHSPRNTCHGKKAAQLVAHQAGRDLPEQFADVGHWRMTCWPSERPWRICVFDPLLMPAVMATRRDPFWDVGSGISTSVERSFLYRIAPSG